MKPRQTKPKVAGVDDSEKWTTEELRALATVRGSVHHKALAKAFTLLRNNEHGVLLDPKVNHDATQFTRGRLSMLADLVLLLEQEAPAAYESRQAESKKPPESSA